jgi:hypothetical protein
MLDQILANSENKQITCEFVIIITDDCNRKLQLKFLQNTLQNIYCQMEYYLFIQLDGILFFYFIQMEWTNC